MPRKRKEPAVSEDTIQAAEAADETIAQAAEAPAAPTPQETAQAEAEAILEAARREAALIRQGAIEEAQAARQRVAEVVPQVNDPDPVPPAANIVPEPVPNKGGGKDVPTFFPGIKRTDY